MNIIKIYSLAFLATIASISIASEQIINDNCPIKGYPIERDACHTRFKLPYGDRHKLIDFVFPDWQDSRKVLADSVAFFDENGQLLTTVRELRRYRKVLKRTTAIEKRSALIERAEQLHDIHDRITNATHVGPLNGYVCEKVVPVYEANGSIDKKGTHAIAIGTTDPQICKKIQKYYDQVIKELEKEKNNQ